MGNLHACLCNNYISFRHQCEDYVCVKFSCYLNTHTLKNANGQLSYKYVVYTDQVTKEDTQFEYLHETENGGYTNRVLNIPNNECKPNSKWACTLHTFRSFSCLAF